jgi:hypothetical protein
VLEDGGGGAEDDGDDGKIWFTERGAAKIGTMT